MAKADLSGLTEFDLRHVVSRLVESGELELSRLADLLEERKAELESLDGRITSLRQQTAERRKPRLSPQVREHRSKLARYAGLMRRLGDSPARAIFEEAKDRIPLEGMIVLLQAYFDQFTEADKHDLVHDRTDGGVDWLERIYDRFRDTGHVTLDES